MDKLCFDPQDFRDQPPPPGFYPSAITTARYRRSAGGNPMLQVVHAVDSVGPAYDRVAEYFVFEGVSAKAVAMARRRLLELYRACGLEPKPGEEVRPDDLQGAELEVKLEHEQWEGQVRLRVAAHRPRTARGPNDTPF